AAAAHASVPPAEHQVAGARAAVKPPTQEDNAHAEQDLVAALGAEPAPSPELEELCQRIYEIIRSKRPPDEEKLVKTDPRGLGRRAGQQLDSSVRGDVTRVGSTYQPIDAQPQGPPGPEPPPIPPAPDVSPTPPLDASSAVPDAVPPANVSLQADV